VSGLPARKTTSRHAGGQLLTGDHNLINVQAEISYRVHEKMSSSSL